MRAPMNNNRQLLSIIVLASVLFFMFWLFLLTRVLTSLDNIIFSPLQEPSFWGAERYALFPLLGGEPRGPEGNVGGSADGPRGDIRDICGLHRGEDPEVGELS